MTKQRGSNKILEENTDKSLLTNRKAWALVNNKHNLVFHTEGHILIFYNKRKAVDYIKYNKVPNNWRPAKITLNIIYNPFNIKESDD